LLRGHSGILCTLPWLKPNYNAKSNSFSLCGLFFCFGISSHNRNAGASVTEMARVIGLLRGEVLASI
jgi:hypothetical protein